ncbi:MAG: DHA2 family efflux MFS transporter permease subunit [Sporolactobacillus sp.]
MNTEKKDKNLERMVALPVSVRTKLAILAAGMLSFLGILVETSMNVTYPILIHEFHTALSLVQWVTTGYLLLVTIVMACSAFILRRFSAKSVFLFAALHFVVGSLFCALSSDFLLLMIGRLLQAVSTGLSTPLMFHIILNKVPSRRLGTYTGLASMIIALAPALGPVYGGVMTTALSWRYIFWLAMPVGVCVLLLGMATISLLAAGNHAAFDYLGVVVLAALLTSIVVAFNEAGRHGWGSMDFIWLLLSAAVLATFFVIHVRTSRSTLLNFSILRVLPVTLGAVNYFSLQFVNIGISFVLPIFAQTVLGTNALVAGLLLLPGSLLGAAVSPVAGRLFDRIGGFWPILAGDGSMAVGCLLFWQFTANLLPITVLIFYLFLRLGFNFGFGNTLTASALELPKQKRADVNALFNMLQQYAGSVGTSVLAALIAAHERILPVGQNALATRLGAHDDFLLLLILATLGVFSTVLIRYRKRHSGSPLTAGDQSL